MTDKIDDSREISEEKFNKKADETIEILSELQKVEMEKTQLLGLSIDLLKEYKKEITIINNNSNLSQTDIIGMTCSGYDFLESIYITSLKVKNTEKKDSIYIRAIASTASTSVETSGSIVAAISPDYEMNLPSPYFFDENEESFVAKLNKISPSLSKTYQQIDQIQYGTNADTAKSMDAEARQAFDHFFSIFAPDNLVKESKYWKQKRQVGREGKVDRRERILYAINTHVKSKFRANMLIKSVDNIMKAYEVLNSLHTRGNINEKASKKAINTLKQFLRDFTSAIEE
jgi:TolA-binding protein